MDLVNKLILEKENVFIYRIPPQMIKTRKIFHRASTWDLSHPIKICKLILTAVGPSCHIQLDDGTGNMFRQSVIHWYPGINGRSSSLTAVVDSSRYFTLEVEKNCDVYDLLGLGFSSHEDSSDLTKTLQNYFISRRQIQEKIKVAVAPVIKIDQKFEPEQMTDMAETDPISEGEEDTTLSLSIIKREQDKFLDDNLELEPVSPVGQEDQLEQEPESQVLLPEGTEPISDDEVVESIPVKIFEKSESKEKKNSKKLVKKQELEKLLAQRNFIGDEGVIEFNFHVRKLVSRNQCQGQGKKLKPVDPNRPGDISAGSFCYREGRTFKCHLCQSKFFGPSRKSKSVLHLENHWKQAHGIEVASLINCISCSLVFSSEDQFSSHKKLFHDFKFRCFLCPKVFAYNVKLCRHLVNCHTPALLELVPKGRQIPTESESMISNITQNNDQDKDQNTTHMDCNLEIISESEDQHPELEECLGAMETITAEDEDYKNEEVDTVEIIAPDKKRRKRKRKIDPPSETPIAKPEIVVDKDDKLHSLIKKLIETHRKKLLEYIDIDASQLKDKSCGGFEYYLPRDILQCHLCPANFPCPSSGSMIIPLRNHWREFHGTDVLTCIFCNLAFLNNSQFTLHKELTHDFDCFLCPASCVKFGGLRRHLIRKHRSLLLELEAEQEVATETDIEVDSFTEATEKGKEDTADGNWKKMAEEEEANSDETDLLKRIIQLNDERKKADSIFKENQSVADNSDDNPEEEPVCKVSKLSIYKSKKEQNNVNSREISLSERSEHYLNKILKKEKFEIVKKLLAKENTIGNLEAKESRKDDSHCIVEEKDSLQDQISSKSPVVEATGQNSTNAQAFDLDYKAYLEEIACGGTYYLIEGNILQCHLCPVNFLPSFPNVSQKELRNHWEAVHEIEIYKMLYCASCHIVFSNEDQLAQHKKLIHDFGCFLCPKLLNSEKSLCRHLRFEHNHPLMFNCEGCPKTFNNLRSFLRHTDTFGH